MPRRFLPIIAAPLLIQIGVPQWWTNTRHLLTMALGDSYHDLLVPTLSPASGFSSIGITLMALLLVTKLGGLFEDFLSSMASTTKRLSVQLLSQQRFGLFSALLRLVLGQFISWMSRTPFFMVI